MKHIPFVLVLKCFGLIIIACFGGCEADRITTEVFDKIQSEHFTFSFGDDISTDERFDTHAAREVYRKIAIGVLEALFADFQERFEFQPEHVINVIVSLTLDGHADHAYARNWTDQYNKITQLDQHFTVSLFENRAVKAHELTHSWLAGFFLPKWADEGVAIYIQNFYEYPPGRIPMLSLEDNLHRDNNGVNGVQHWKTGQGICADAKITSWCYHYSFSIVSQIETTWKGAFAKVFARGPSHQQLDSAMFVQLLDEIIVEDDVTAFFEGIGFQFD